MRITHATGDISFYEDTGTTAKLFWDASAESLGIGTTSPNADLHISSILPDIRLEDSNDGSEARISYNTAGNNGLRISVDEDGEVANSIMAFRVDGSEAMRIDSSGLVGIGTSAMSSYNANWNDLVIDGGTSSGLTVVSATTGIGTLAFADGTTGNEQYRGYVQYSHNDDELSICLLYTSPSPRDRTRSRMPSSA